MENKAKWDMRQKPNQCQSIYASSIDIKIMPCMAQAPQ